MIEQPTDREAKLASERNNRLQRRLLRKRTASVLLCVGCSATAVATGVFGFAMLAFCAIVVAIICLIQYFDANGHLHEVRRRSKKTLVPRLSLLAQKDRRETPAQGQPLAQGP